MNDVHIEQPYDTLHVHLFNSIYQKSNNEQIMYPKDLNVGTIRYMYYDKDVHYNHPSQSIQ